ncbi:MAG: lamin tail domain-containing protein [Nanoarchaeota archaeon]|nr:lamin tail domain-containing protein [Nanoarchaeota archaeon]
MKLFLLFSIFFIIPSVTAGLINEILYDPEGTDQGQEYIEVIHEENYSLENFTLFDSTSNDTIKLIKKIANNYSLIVTNDFNHTTINASIYTVGTTIGNGLNNDKDTIMIKGLNNTIIDNITYNNSNVENGQSICRTITWIGCTPTPGTTNILPIPQENTTINQTENITQPINQTNTTEPPPIINQTVPTITYTLTITEIKPNPKGNDKQPYPNDEWLEVYNYGTETLTLLGLTIEDEQHHRLIISETNLPEGTHVQPKQYQAIHLNGWSIMNNNHDNISINNQNQIIDSVNYGTINEDYSWSLIEETWEQTLPTPNEANEVPETTPSILIKKIPTTAQFNELLPITLELYKGTAIADKVTIEFLNKKTTFYINNPYTNISLTLPLASYKTCTTKDNNKYPLTITGFDTNTTAMINLSCPITKETTKKQEENKTVKTTTQITRNYTKTTTAEKLIKPPETIYRSTTFKARDYSTYLFILVLILLSSYQLIRKKP